MIWYRVTQVLPTALGLLWVGAVGACIGSLINVLVYRLPRGLPVIAPPSRCPACETRLTWRENIPVLGWLLLRGRCRFCRSPISPEYPIVEAVTALAFAGVYALWFLGQDHGWRPEWALNGIGLAWPILVVQLVLVSCLIAMTIVDARTYTIPLVLAWAPALVAVVVLPTHAAWVEASLGEFAGRADGTWITTEGRRWEAARGWVWSLATPGLRDWRLIGASVGGFVGLGASGVLLRLGLIRRSFADYEAWEAEELARRDTAVGPDGGAAERDEEPGDAPDLWVRYPHARREMFKEIAFLSLPLCLAVGGWFAAGALVRWLAGPPVPLDAYGAAVWPVSAPLWLAVMSGVLWGYLLGGGVVWAVRIAGTLGFDKEAMGLGDVHLMAGVGACLGWVDAVLGFFGAAFVGLAYTIAALLSSGRLRRAMPFGPFLAVASVLVLLGKPAVESFLGALLGGGGAGAGPLDLP